MVRASDNTMEIRTMCGWIVRFRWVIVTTTEQLEEMRRLRYAQLVTFDTETSGLKVSLGARAIGYCLAAVTAQDEITGYYVPVRHVNDDSVPQLPIEQVAPVIQEILDAEEGSAFIAGLHHAKFDMAMARADGIRIKRKIRDTAILATVENENEASFKLKKLGDKYCWSRSSEGEKALDDWMKKDARGLKLCFKKRSKKTPDAPTYLERFGYSRTPIEMCGRYGAFDVFLTLYLLAIRYGRTEEQFPAVTEREHRVMRVLHEMEWVGLPADREEILRAHRAARTDLAYWIDQATTLGNEALQAHNPGAELITEFELSPQFLSTLLYKQLGLMSPKQTDSGADSTDKEARQLLAHQYPAFAPLIHAIDKAAKVEKLASTYTDAFLTHYAEDTGRIHPSYNQLERRDEGGVPVTGRLSSGEPNIQNCAKKPAHLHDCRCGACVAEELHKKVKDLDESERLLIGAENTISVRRYFTVPKGFIRLFIDFSQIELRVLAWFSRDPRLLECYADDLDVHAMTADEVTGGDRDTAKQVNFGNSYGMTEIGLAKRMAGYYRDPQGTRERAKMILRQYFRTYAGILRFRDEFARSMRANGNMFVNPFGRPRRIPDIGAHEQWKRERAQRMMMSSIISGTAADIMKESMLRCDHILAERSPESKTVQSIHDELVFDLRLLPGWATTAVALVRAMEDWPMFSDRGVPIRVNAKFSTTNWEELRDIKILPDGRLQLAA